MGKGRCGGMVTVKVVAAALLVCALGGCSGRIAVTRADERAVMEVMLAEFVAPGGAVRIEAEVFRRPEISEFEEWDEDPVLRAGLVEAYRDEEQGEALHDAWVGEWGLGFVSAGEVERHFGRVRDDVSSLDEAWESFLRGPPACEGLLKLSRPCFSDDGTQALMIIDEGAGSLDAHGGIYLLERTDGGWRVVTPMVIWVS